MREGPRSRSTASAEAGFTLVELMISVFLLTVGVLAVSQVFVIADRHTSFAREETVAVTLAREIQEKILSETFSDIDQIFDGVDTNDPQSLTEPSELWGEHVAERLGSTGRGVVEVTTYEEDPGAVPYGMVSVLVTMSWYEGSSEVSVPVRFNIAKIGA